ncbi:MAG: DUF4595 domain-containing protein [Duncaniella sp.]|nr:DUF4595 domain-containing protein [Duncaniella sp.]
MKFLKSRAIVIMAIASCVGFVSCSDDDKDGPDGGGGNEEMVVNPSKVFTAGVPKQVGAMSVVTDAKGLISSMSSAEDGVKIVFSYPVMSRSESYDVVMDVDDEGDKTSFNMLLNDMGFARYCKQIESDGDIEEWWFEYNADGRLIKMKRSEGGNEVTEITYQNGNISKVRMRSEDDGDGGDYAIGYRSSMIENKGCIMLFDETFGIDMDEMKYAYFAGLLGKATKNMPESNAYTRFDPDGEPYEWNKTFKWSMNSDNLPVMLTTQTTDEWGPEEPEIFEFKW